MGRPPTYTHEDRGRIGDAIYQALSDGELLTDQWRKHPISPATWWRWLEEDEELREIFSRARVNQAHALAEKTMQNAVAAHGETGEEIQARRLIADTNKWFVSKIAPRLYGDKLDITSAGQRIGVIALPPETDSASMILPSVEPPNDG